jgi:putative endonuclease
MIRFCISASRTVLRAAHGNLEKALARIFPDRYQCRKLIYHERYRDIRDAIARESQLKKWSRAKKTALINRMNPRWLDLGADVLQDM